MNSYVNIKSGFGFCKNIWKGLSLTENRGRAGECYCLSEMMLELMLEILRTFLIPLFFIIDCYVRWRICLCWSFLLCFCVVCAAHRLLVSGVV